ncbi:MAG: hypothetical protein AAB583_03610, partial [Patescibacteria group bacterium]
MSEVPMPEQEISITIPKVEQKPTVGPKKITEQDINTAVRDVVRKTDIQRVKSSEQPEKAFSSGALNDIKSADATTQEELKKHPLKRVRAAFKFYTNKTRLALATSTVLVVCNFLSAEKQNVPPPPTPTSAVSQMPEGMPSARAPLVETPMTPITKPSEQPTQATETPMPPPTIEKQPPKATPESTSAPALTPTPEITQKPTVETPTPTPESTLTVEIQQSKVISMGGSVETDPASPPGESIKLVFPEGIVDGELPLIPKGDTLNLSV